MTTPTAAPWWAEYADRIPPAFTRLIAAEDLAARIYTYESWWVPGLLQSGRYAAQVMLTAPGVTDGEVEWGMRLRAGRQRILLRDEASPELHVVVAEEVLQRAAVTKAGADQLRYLRQAAGRHGVTVQVLPVAAGPVVAGAHPFTVVEPRSDVEPAAAYVETPSGAALFTAPDPETEGYRMRFAAVSATSYDPDRSLQVIRGLCP